MAVQELHTWPEMHKARRITSESWLWAISVVLLLCVEGAVVFGAPILGPDLDNCELVVPPRRAESYSVDCCLLDRPIKKFKFNPDLPKRIRRPVHLLDQDYIDKYNKAVGLLRALPDDDPRSWWQQANLHCSYCAAAYSQINSTEKLDVHDGWLLMPFHRWYMYFHERILGSLIGDDTFALPYWAWDVQNATNPPANRMPEIYVDKSSPLYDELRCQMHMPPAIADLEIQAKAHNKEPMVQLEHNYHNMWRVMIGEVKTPASFYGGKFTYGDSPHGRAGRFELGPHAAIHAWTGDDTHFGDDMGPPYAAARDPIFFAHHSQVDRLWLMWKNMGGQDYDDDDWLDSEFLFFDENADLVRVSVRESLDWSKFNIGYEDVTADWLDYVPTSIRTNNPKLAKLGFLGRLRRSLSQVLAGQKSLPGMLGIRLAQDFEQNLILKRRAALTSEIALPGASAKRSMLKSGVASVVEEVLVLEGVVTKPFDMMVLYNVFIDLPEADESTRVDCTESLGAFHVDPVGRKGNDIIQRKFSHEICIGDRLKLLGLTGSSSIEITFVPKWDAIYDEAVQVEFTKVAIELHKVK